MLRMSEQPLWVKWVLSCGIALILLVALIIYVDHHNTDASNGQALTPQGQTSANHLAIVLAQEQQAPHVVRAPAGATPATSIAHAVHLQMNTLINDQEAGPPVSPARCYATSARAGQGVRGFTCTDLAGGQYFDFVGVVDVKTRLVTVCRRDPPPVQSLTVPVSRRCVA
jgi:hypothetical protein